jgi:tetratricopeptide (TPR) repeat protein
MRIVITITCIILASNCLAQAENNDINTGNKYYHEQNLTEAEKNYQSALQKNPQSEPAHFNLGAALFGQEKFDEAVQQFEQVGQTATDPSVRAGAYHNLGNALLMKQDYEKSIEAYKKALKANPDDMDTKYNLAYAQKKLKQQQQQNQQQNQQQDQQQNQQEQNQQNQQQNKNEQQQNDNENKESQQKPSNTNEQQQADQPQPGKYTQEELERIMEALNNKDKRTQDKLSKQKMETQTTDTEKDW